MISHIKSVRWKTVAHKISTSLLLLVYDLGDVQTTPKREYIISHNFVTAWFLAISAWHMPIRRLSEANLPKFGKKIWWFDPLTTHVCHQKSARMHKYSLSHHYHSTIKWAHNDTVAQTPFAWNCRSCYILFTSFYQHEVITPTVKAVKKEDIIWNQLHCCSIVCASG